MKIVFTSYISSPEYDEPGAWLKRIKAYTGILESLSTTDTVISFERINYEGLYENNGVQYRFIKFKNKKIFIPRRMHLQIKKLQPDVVIVHGLHFPLQVIQLRSMLGKKVKIIVQHHAERPFRGIKRILQKWADRSIDAYLFTSSEMGTDWNGIITDKKKIVEIMEASSVFHPVDKNFALSKTKIHGQPVFLWVGRLDANKDPLTVVRAFLRFIKKQPGARLYMIYHTDELKHKIETLIRMENGSEDKIVLIGKLPHVEMGYWFNSADFIISGSHYEGSGVAVCEAMSCGCIPILTDIKSFRKITGRGKCGLLYKPGDEKELLSVLLQSRQLNLHEEKTKVLRQFREELSFDAIARKIHLAGSR